MTKERLKAKLDAFEHRAFWWVIDDLQNALGPEIGVKFQADIIKRLYIEQLKKMDDGETKFKQLEIV